jgi:hypothetical protein
MHIATMGEYQKIGSELLEKIIISDLLLFCDELNICIVGDGIFEIPYQSDKIKIHKLGQIHEFEFPTLQFIENVIQETKENIKIFYLNGLGVTNNTIYKQSWRKYLSYFNIIKFNKCVEALDNGYDICGVDWRTHPVPHYSGNFWWANSDYLKTLPKIESLNKSNSPIILTLRHNAEMYIGMNSNVKPRILHQSTVSQYTRHLKEYDEKNYIDKISEEDIIIDLIPD